MGNIENDIIINLQSVFSTDFSRAMAVFLARDLGTIIIVVTLLLLIRNIIRDFFATNFMGISIFSFDIKKFFFSLFGKKDINQILKEEGESLSSNLKKLRRDIEATYSIIFVSLFAWTSSLILKISFLRERPFVQNQNIEPIIDKIGSGSFPSGHAVFFFAMAFMMSKFYPKYSRFYFVLAILISLFRVVSGVHFVSDVVIGSIWGILIAKYTYHFIDKIFIAKRANKE
ncbi:MAG: phosphatase PAP2 family protein [Candidatus Nomurabacteria bacterium]|nr:MAG: phosphatase PAP2 family protein [Candidatus Nomurabacteria bacterium]